MLSNLPPSSFFDRPKPMRAKGLLSSAEWSRRIELTYPSDVPRRARSEAHRGVFPSESAVGLSNTPYLHANPLTLEFLINPASALIRVRPSRKYADYDTSTSLSTRRAKRGRILKFSDKSRLGLQLLSADLQAVVRAPDLMLTLTYPADWETATTDSTCYCEASMGCSDVPCICEFGPSGKLVKKHLKAFRERTKRYLKKLGITVWGALWFFEFQKRGAPHLHLLLFGPTLRALDLSHLQGWLSSAWANIVAHPDPSEYEKHVKAGTRVEWCRKAHFGYALKYAAKMQQKTVPLEFADIGRFWGVWNSPLKAPHLRAFYPTAETFRIVSKGLRERLSKHSFHFANKLYDALESPPDSAHFTFRVFGVECSDYLLSYGKPSG
jgi:hypothetical protein